VDDTKQDDCEITFSYEFNVQENTALESIFDWLCEQVEAGNQSQDQ
jgi:hypothetical protein